MDFGRLVCPLTTAFPSTSPSFSSSLPKVYWSFQKRAGLQGYRLKTSKWCLIRLGTNPHVWIMQPGKERVPRIDNNITDNPISTVWSHANTQIQTNIARMLRTGIGSCRLHDWCFSLCEFLLSLFSWLCALCSGFLNPPPPTILISLLPRGPENFS